MLTEFGRFLRTLRLEKHELLKEMAGKLNVSSPFLSAVETGKKNVPGEMIKVLGNLYQLTEEEKAEMNDALKRSVRSVSIDLSNTSREHRELAIALARKFNSLDVKTLATIKDSIAKSSEGKDGDDA